MSDQTRKAFEEWVIGPTGTGRPWRCTEPGFTHQYDDSHTELAWRAWTASRKLAMQEAASKLDLSPSALRLMAGEMTAGEVRTVQAVLNGIAASLRKEAK